MRLFTRTRAVSPGRRATAAALSVLLLTASASPAFATPDDHGDTGKITICHATDAASNPYRMITVDPAAFFQQGHDDHTGPVFDPAVHDQHNRGWGDIIPVFDYHYTVGQQEISGTYEGLNWTEYGQQILAADCTIPVVPDEPETVETTLVVEKQVVGTSTASFPFSLVDPLTEDTVEFSLGDDGTRGFTWVTPVPTKNHATDATLTVVLTETATHGATTTVATLDGSALPGTGASWTFDLDVGSSHRVVVTNTFVTPPVVPPPVVPPPVVPPPVVPPPVVPPTVLPPEVVEVPDITLVKTADIAPDAAGDRVVVTSATDPGSITYTFLITNTGDTALGDLTLVDDMIGTVTLPTSALAPDEFVTVTATYLITEDDVEAGAVVNTAVVTGTVDADTTVSDTDDEVVLIVEVLPGVVDVDDETDVDEEETEVLPIAAELPVTGGGLASLTLLGALLLLAGAALVTPRGAVAAVHPRPGRRR